MRKGSGKGSGFLVDCIKFWLLNIGSQERVAIVANIFPVVFLNHRNAGSGLFGNPLLITAQRQRDADKSVSRVVERARS